MKIIARSLSLLVFAIYIFVSEKNSFAHSYDTSIIVGPTFSTHSFDSSITSLAGTPSMGVGYSFGSFIGFDFSEFLGAEFGVLFTKRTTSFPGNLKFNSTMLNLPLLLRISPITTLAGLKFEVGPYLGIIPTSSFSQSGTTGYLNSDLDSTDFGLMGGISYFAPINDAIQFRISALYSFGLTDLSGGGDIRTRGLDGYVGIVILR